MSTPCLIAVRLKKSEKDTTNLVERFNGEFPAATETYKYVFSKFNGTAAGERKFERISYSKVNRNKKLMAQALETYENCPVSMDKDYIYIYCHWDGDTRLKTLQKCFSTYEKALQLIMLGACSYVDEKGVMPYMLAPSNVGSKDWGGDNKPSSTDDINGELKNFFGIYNLYVFDDEREEGAKWEFNPD